MIEKREQNPELSVFSNMVLDLVDFKDRVRPLSNDISMLENAMKYQKQNVQEMLDNRAEFRRVVDEVSEPGFTLDKIEPGYKSADLPEPKEPEVMAAEPETHTEEHHAEDLDAETETKSDFDSEGYKINNDEEEKK